MPKVKKDQDVPEYRTNRQLLAVIIWHSVGKDKICLRV